MPANRSHRSKCYVITLLNNAYACVMNPLVNRRPSFSAAATDDEAHVISTSAEALSNVLEPGVNLCVWQRPVVQEVSEELRLLDAHQLPDVRSQSSPATFDADLCALLERYGLQPEAFRAWRSDLQQLARLYFPLTDGRKVTLRLETTDTDGCRRFHTDRTNLRLLCTYRGPGTEWLPDAQVDRDAQYAGAANEDILRYGEPSQLQPFWVGILKGTAYPGNADQGLVHRSPPIANTGHVRVLFCLDC